MKKKLPIERWYRRKNTDIEGVKIDPLAGTIFDTATFKALSRTSKADFIFANLEELDSMSPPAIEEVATYLLKSQCACELIEVRRLPNGEMKVKNIPHRDDCMAGLYPTDSDVSDSTIRKRRQREIVLEPEAITIIEEAVSLCGGQLCSV